MSAILQTTFRMFPTIHTLGTLTLAYFSYRTLQFFSNLLRPSTLPRYLHQHQTRNTTQRPLTKSWALITGATDGIGLSLAHELAAAGFHLILHGRNATKLEKVSSSLRSQHAGLETHSFIADASSPNPSFAKLQDLLSTGNPRLTVLVNNVGGNTNVSPDPFIYLHERTAESIASSIDLNIGFTTKLTALLLPRLMRNEPSLIVNIGSTAALGVPCLNIYAGAKAYLLAFTKSLYADLVEQERDVDVQFLWLGAVQSN